MRVRYTGHSSVYVPGVPGLWHTGQEEDVSPDAGARLLHNVWFHEVSLPDPLLDLVLASVPDADQEQPPAAFVAPLPPPSDLSPLQEDDP